VVRLTYISLPARFGLQSLYIRRHHRHSPGSNETQGLVDHSVHAMAPPGSGWPAAASHATVDDIALLGTLPHPDIASEDREAFLTAIYGSGTSKPPSTRHTTQANWVPEGRLVGNTRLGFRQMFGHTYSPNSPIVTGLVLQCRLHTKSAPHINYKASFVKPQNSGHTAVRCPG
jgi:hypothetical protein